MPEVTDAELTILGLLAEKSRHGYELEQVVDERGIREWTTLGFSSIYYLLDKLAARGLIQAESRGSRGRKVFTITEEGIQACAQAALASLAEVRPTYPSVLVGLATSPLIGSRELKAALRQRDEALGQRLQTIADTRTRQQPLPDFVDAIFDYSLSLMQAEREWLARTVSRLGVNMKKVDFRKEVKELYAPSSRDFTVVDVPPMSFLMVDGEGNPNTSKSYSDAVEALYSVSYALKFASKNELGKDYVVAPLEGLWSAANPSAFVRRAKDEWRWTMMIMQPAWITTEMVDQAVQATQAKKKLAALSLLRFEDYEEGTSVQILHVGSYEEEEPTLKRLHQEYMPAHNLDFNGPHHEIYLGDPRRSEPSKLKTILRQPVKMR